MKKILSLIIAFLLIFSCASASKDEDFVSVSDNAGILSDAVERYIYTVNKDLHQKAGARIVFCTENSIGSSSCVEYADSLYSSMGISKIGRNNCVFVFVCKDDSDYTVKVGEGISGVLTDADAQRYLYKYMEKDFAKGNYDRAILKTFNAFGKWYAERYAIELSLTEDMTSFKNIVKTEHKKEKVRSFVITLACVVSVFLLFWIAAHIRRKRRMARIRRRRQERRRRYNLAKHGDRKVRL